MSAIRGRSMQRATTIVLVASAALSLGGCAATSHLLHGATPDPLAAKAAKQLSALKADPQVAQRAPDALQDAVAAVQAAQDPEGTPEDARHLAVVAEKRVQIARALTDASKYEDAYTSLVAKRDAMGGGNKTVTTLSQPQAPVSLPAPTPISTPTLAAPETAPTPVATATPKLAAVQKLQPTQAPSPSPAVSAASGPTLTGTHGALLTLPEEGFSANGSLEPPARKALHSLLPTLVQHPSATIIVSGASPAQVSAVRAALIKLGVPQWHLKTRARGKEVKVRFASGTVQ